MDNDETRAFCRVPHLCTHAYFQGTEKFAKLLLEKLKDAMQSRISDVSTLLSPPLFCLF